MNPLDSRCALIHRLGHSWLDSIYAWYHGPNTKPDPSVGMVQLKLDLVETDIELTLLSRGQQPIALSNLSLQVRIAVLLLLPCG